MTNTDQSFHPRPTGYRDLFGTPALERQRKPDRLTRLRRACPDMLSDGDLLYLEVSEALEQLDAPVIEALDAIVDHERRQGRGGRSA